MLLWQRNVNCRLVDYLKENTKQITRNHTNDRNEMTTQCVHRLPAEHTTRMCNNLDEAEISE